MIPLIPRLALAAIASALTWSALSAQSSGQAPVATFRGGTDLLRIDVSVLDKNRKPVRGLTAADFTVLEDGEPRPIAAFTAVDLPPVLKVTAAWAREIAPDVATNVWPDEGRLVVILLDRSIPPGEPTRVARQIATTAVDALSPTDLAAVTFTRTGTPQDFTSDRRLLLRAIDGTDPGTEGSADAAEVDAAFHNGVYLPPGECLCGLCVPEAIERIAVALRDNPRPKLLIFIGTTTVIQEADSHQLDCQFKLKNARTKMLHALDTSNLTMHALTPTGLESVTRTGQASARNGDANGGAVRDTNSNTRTTDVAAALQGNVDRDSSIRALPEYTGGRTVANTNDPARLVPQIFEESASYYLVGFRPEAGGAPSRPHKIEVRVNRKGLDVRSLRTYEPTPAVIADSPANAGGPPAAVTRALAGALSDPGWPLTATAAPFAIPGQRDAGVLVVTGVRHDVDAPAAAAGTASRTERVDVLSAALDARARPKGSDGHTVDVTFAPAANGALEYEVFSKLSLPPGRYEIRTAASNGARSGSVITYLDVPDFAGDPLSLSGLVLDEAQPAASAPRDLVNGWLPVLPTTRRTFHPEDRVGAFLRVYQGGNGLLASATIDARIVDMSDRTVFSNRVTKASDLFAVNRAMDYRLELPLARLSAGEYLLTVEATMGRTVARRDLRFSVSGATAGAPASVAMRAPVSSGAATSTAPALASVLSAAGNYLDAYARTLLAVVAQEDYTQQTQGQPRTMRRLRSDLLVAQIGAAGWVGFRDVFEVDGLPVRDHDERLAKLFVNGPPDTPQQVQRILAESARFNLNVDDLPVDRTINMPFTALLFLRSANQPRSAFQLGAMEVIDGLSCVEVQFTEQAMPRLLASDNQSPAGGKFWVDPVSGLIVRTELVMRTSRRLTAPMSANTPAGTRIDVTATIRVNYHQEPKLGSWLPTTMDEVYIMETSRGGGASVTGRASYSGFRQFNVSTDTTAK